MKLQKLCYLLRALEKPHSWLFLLEVEEKLLLLMAEKVFRLRREIT